MRTPLSPEEIVWEASREMREFVEHGLRKVTKTVTLRARSPPWQGI
jgi:hypothetical protein